jgi:hypothetical protein
MAADAGLLLAIGPPLFLIGFVPVVALCLKALGQGSEVEAEVRVLSLCLRFHVRPLGSPSRIAAGSSPPRGSGRQQRALTLPGYIDRHAFVRAAKAALILARARRDRLPSVQLRSSRPSVSSPGSTPRPFASFWIVVSRGSRPPRSIRPMLVSWIPEVCASPSCERPLWFAPHGRVDRRPCCRGRGRRRSARPLGERCGSRPIGPERIGRKPFGWERIGLIGCPCS